MSKTTSVSSFYTSDIKANGTTVSGDEVYAPNDIIVYRIKVNGTDVIHKFTRTIVMAYSNLTFTIVLRYNVISSTSCGYSDYWFDSPIYLDITVSGSGFTSITGVEVATQYYCGEGDLHSPDTDEYFYAYALSNQSFTIGQQKTLTFSYYDNKAIEYEKTSPPQPEKFRIFFMFTDPDGVTLSVPDIIVKPEYHYTAGENSYVNQTLTGTRVVNGQVLSDTTVQEY